MTHKIQFGLRFVCQTIASSRTSLTKNFEVLLDKHHSNRILCCRIDIDRCQKRIPPMIKSWKRYNALSIATMWCVCVCVAIGIVQFNGNLVHFGSIINTYSDTIEVSHQSFQWNSQLNGWTLNEIPLPWVDFAFVSVRYKNGNVFVWFLFAFSFFSLPKWWIHGFSFPLLPCSQASFNLNVLFWEKKIVFFCLLKAWKRLRSTIKNKIVKKNFQTLPDHWCWCI